MLQKIIRGTLADIAERFAADPVERTAIIFVGPSLAADCLVVVLYGGTVSATLVLVVWVLLTVAMTFFLPRLHRPGTPVLGR